MKTIQLKSIKIRHFKGIANLEGNFGTNTFIIGANGTGKSSIYDAYLWCLFGKDYSGSTLEVRTLDKDNQPLHKVVTEVEMVLDVDGVEMKICRREKEKWVVARGTATEEYKGQEQEFVINDVPYSKRDFTDKLNSICNVEDWFMLSSISAFMNLKMEVRRQRLQKLTEDISDEEVAADYYPHVLKALQEGKSADELKRQNKVSKDNAKLTLEQIPIRIDQQEKMRVVVDESALNKEKEEKQKELDAVEQELNNIRTQKPGAIAEGIEQELSGINSDIARIKEQAQQKFDEEMRQHSSRINSLYTQRSTATSEINMRKSTISRIEQDIIGYDKSIALIDEERAELQKRAFVANVDDTCPTCGQKIPNEKYDAMVEEARSRFNTKLVADKNACDERGLTQKKHKESLEAQKKLEEENIQKLEAQIKELDVQLQDPTYKGATVESVLDGNAEYQGLLARKADVESKREQLSFGMADAKEEYERLYNNAFMRKRELEAKLNDVNHSLYALDTNKRIDAEIARLNEQSATTAQVLAECEDIEFEIMQFKKRKITLVEKAVSSLFEIVRWKMYEQNVTNDGEKELCEALIDGVPYDSVNTATKYNAGIDIINGLSKAMDMYVPLFVDNAESVTNLRPALSQLITLTVVAGQELTIR